MPIQQPLAVGPGPALQYGAVPHSREDATHARDRGAHSIRERSVTTSSGKSTVSVSRWPRRGRQPGRG